MHDGRQLEVVANGLPLHNGAQLAVDTTLVSPVRRNGVPQPGAARTDGYNILYIIYNIGYIIYNIIHAGSRPTQNH